MKESARNQQKASSKSSQPPSSSSQPPSSSSHPPSQQPRQQQPQPQQVLQPIPLQQVPPEPMAHGFEQFASEFRSNSEIANQRRRYIHAEATPAHDPFTSDLAVLQTMKSMGIDVEGSNLDKPDILESIYLFLDENAGLKESVVPEPAMPTIIIPEYEITIVSTEMAQAVVMESTPRAVTRRRVDDPSKRKAVAGGSSGGGKLCGKKYMSETVSRFAAEADLSDNLTGLLHQYHGKSETSKAPASVQRPKRRILQLDDIPEVEEGGSSASKINISMPNQIHYETNISQFSTTDTMTEQEEIAVKQMTSLMPKFGLNLIHREKEICSIREIANFAVVNHAHRHSNFQTAYRNGINMSDNFMKMERREIMPPEIQATPIVKEVHRNITFLNLEAETYYNFAKLLQIDADRTHSMNKELEARIARQNKDAEGYRMEIERLQNEVSKFSKFQRHNEILSKGISEAFSMYQGTYQRMYNLWANPSEENKNAAALDMRSIRDTLVRRCGNDQLLIVPPSLDVAEAARDEEEDEDDEVEETTGKQIK